MNVTRLMACRSPCAGRFAGRGRCRHSHRRFGLGASRATFILSQDGRPVFIRRLPDCGFSRILEQIENRLGLSASEFARLLVAVGLDSSDHHPRNPMVRAVSQAALTTFRILADEIRRTLKFLKAGWAHRTQEVNSPGRRSLDQTHLFANDRIDGPQGGNLGRAGSGWASRWRNSGCRVRNCLCGGYRR